MHLFGAGRESDIALAKLEDSRLRQEFEDRRSEARFTRRVFEGNFPEDVREVLRFRFAAETFKKLQLESGLSTEENILQDILNRVAVAWSEGARYWLTDPADTDSQNPAFDAQMAEYDYDNLGKIIDLWTELYRRILVVPEVVFDEDAGMRVHQHCIYTPENFDVIRHPKSKSVVGQILYGEDWEKVVGTGGRGKRFETALVWYRDVWKLWTDNGKGKWEVKDEGPNEYGILPGQLFGRRKTYGNQTWLEVPGPRLAALTVNVNAWVTYSDLMAAGNVKVIAGNLNNNGFASGQNVRPSGGLDTGTAQNVQVLDLTTDIGGFRKAKVDVPKESASAAHNLQPTEFTSSSQPPSGESLRLQYWSRDRYAVNKRSFIAKDLQGLYRRDTRIDYVELQRIDEEHGMVIPIRGISELPFSSPAYPGIVGEGIEEGWTFHIDPNEIRYPELTAERQARLQLDLALGLTNRVEEMMRNNPGMSSEEAWQKILGNTNIEMLLSNKARSKVEAARRGLDLSVPQKPGEQGKEGAVDGKDPLRGDGEKPEGKMKQAPTGGA